MINLCAYLLLSFVLCCYGLPHSYIVGGDNAAVGQYPYQVSLRLNGRHFCGGSIISSRHILTAGHCIKGQPVQKIRAHVGVNYLSLVGKEHIVSNAVTLAYYDKRGTIQNDVAVIKVFNEIQFTDRVKPIKLATFPTKPGTTAVASGWGRLWNEGSIPDALQHINLTVIPTKQCALYYHSVQSSNVCTLTKRGQGVCKGDSGSPLVVNGEQIGVVSYGTVCASGYPDVYANVANFTAWIQSQMVWSGQDSNNPANPGTGDKKGNNPANHPFPSISMICFVIAIVYAMW